eukprot:SAG31_NODE_1558_length_7885_cov_2.567300_10_plen_169_part_00
MHIDELSLDGNLLTLPLHNRDLWIQLQFLCMAVQHETSVAASDSNGKLDDAGSTVRKAAKIDSTVGDNSACRTAFGHETELVFLYNLVEGISANSHGRMVARLAGIPNKLLERAAAVAAAVESGSPIEPLRDNSEKDDIPSEVAELVASRFMNLDLDSDDVISFISAL